LAAAEELLREALELADPAGECAVRYNLALVLEAAAQQIDEGEGAEAARAAAAAYREAAAVAAAAPAECAHLPSGLAPAGEPTVDETWERSAAAGLGEAATRATAAADEAGERAMVPTEGEPVTEPADPGPEPAPPSPPTDRQHELEQRM